MDKPSLSYVLKIKSTRLRKENFALQLSIDQARSNNELVALGGSQTLRFIQQINNKRAGFPPEFSKEEQIARLKAAIGSLKQAKAAAPNRKKIKALHTELNEIMFVKDYVLVVMDSVRDFDRLNSKKGFYINGIRYKRLLATPGGAKKSTVVYVSEPVYDELNVRLDNGRDAGKKMVPAKLEAYRALACSSSAPVSRPRGVLIVKDCFTSFRSNVIEIDDTKSDSPNITAVSDYLIKQMNASDGCGLMLPERSHTWGRELGEEGYPSLVIRNAFCKGALHPFPFLEFAERVAHHYMVTDAWGTPRDIRDYDVVLTTSMLKLWDSYSSAEHYWACCEEHGYTFSVTKATPAELDREQTLNYQFIQSLLLDDEDVSAITAPTVHEIKQTLGGDYRKAVLFLRGTRLSAGTALKGRPDFIQALMIEPQMMDDPYVRSHIHKRNRKRIDEAKIGVLKVHGNFSMISGDPFTLCQSIFGMELTGLLKAGEFYSRYWSDRHVTRVAAFRAPMTCHNNIRILDIKKDEQMAFWYRYMNAVTVFNSWDTAAYALNGADFDGDAVLTTDNPVILKSIRQLDAILCVQKSAEKVVPTEKDLIKANKDSFGDAIGTITNRITAMFDVMASFGQDSSEYQEMMYRIMAGQNYQQNAIDKSKGIEAKPMPKEWYERKLNLPPLAKGIEEIAETKEVPPEEEERRAFNLRLTADKKPYFFIWKDPVEFRKYKKFQEHAEGNCFIRFGITLEQLMSRPPEDMTPEQAEFLRWYPIMLPVSTSRSVMNRICRIVEREFAGIPLEIRSAEFDWSILKSATAYSQARYKEIEALYKLHNAELREFMERQSDFSNLDEQEEFESRERFVEKFKEQALAICSNEEDLCNMVVDLCYGQQKSTSSKQFAWDVAGERLIQHLLERRNGVYSYPEKDDTGPIEYGGYRFAWRQAQVKDFRAESDLVENYPE